MDKGIQGRWSQRLFLVSMFCTFVGLMLLADAPTRAQDPLNYVGERECNDCHGDIADHQEISAHALSLIAPSDHPDQIIGDFAQENPSLLYQFSDEEEARIIRLEDIAYAVGSGRRFQQYIIETAPQEYRIVPIVWNAEIGSWETLGRVTDQWNEECTGCHVTGYNPEQRDWVDDGVQCEACHGAGEQHVDIVDDAGRNIDEEEAVLIRESIITSPDLEICQSCHNTSLNDGIHLATMSFISGDTLIAGVGGRATAHATAADAPDCIACHMDSRMIDDEQVTNHRMDMEIEEQSAICAECHTDLTLSYARRFIINQQEDTTQRLLVIKNHLNDVPASDWLLDAVQLIEADSSLGVHNVAYTEAILNAIEGQLGLVSQSTLFAVNTVSNPLECAECHSDAYAEWLDSTHSLASLNEQFQSVYSSNGQPAYCLRCHASGFDAAAQSIQYEGVVCSTCHIIEGEHPPAPATMGTNIATCATCHSGGHASVYEEWLASKHSAAGVDCVDCHNAHSNAMLLNDVNSTCGDCHADAMQDEVHMGEGLVCTDCHMTPRQPINGPTMLTQTGHAMKIDPSVCADCHGMMHSLTQSMQSLDGEPVDIDALQEEVHEWQIIAEQNLSSGLLGGAVGVLLLIGLVYLVLRLGRST